MIEISFSLFGLLAGIYGVLFRKKIVAMNKRLASQRNDPVSQQITKQSNSDAHKLVLLIGVALIIMSSVKLLTYYGIV